MTSLRSIQVLIFFGLVFSFCSVRADKPVLSLVIDDLGYSFHQAKQVFNLPGEHTFAIIPGTTYDKKIARYAHQNGHEVILHMPMQSTLDVLIESHALTDRMSEHEIMSRVRSMISEMPYIKGINNHMGSRLTEMAYVMRPVMETIKKYNSTLFFLDSRTTPLSRAYSQAIKAGVPSLVRDVFLDFDHKNPASIAFQYDRWLKKARERGYAIGIAHPYQNTVELLQTRLAQTAADYQFMTLSNLVQHQQEEIPEWQTYLSHLQKGSKNSKP